LADISVSSFIGGNVPMFCVS